MRKIRKTAKGEFQLQTSSGEIRGKRCILATGGTSAPKTGSDGSGYFLASSLGHTVKKPLPALVSLISPEPWLGAAAGVRAQSGVSLQVDGRTVASDAGELQFTKDGISGIPTFQISRFASIALNERRKVTARIDFVPEMSQDHLRQVLTDQAGNFRYADSQTSVPRNRGAEGKKTAIKYGDPSGHALSGSLKTWRQILCGLVSQKIADLITEDLKPAGVPVSELPEKAFRRQIAVILRRLKETSLQITGTGSSAQAQTTCGGVLLSEVDADMQSKRVTGLYFAGEILNVDGICGGYNLQWAWTSGFLAGSNAGKMLIS